MFHSARRLRLYLQPPPLEPPASRQGHPELELPGRGTVSHPFSTEPGLWYRLAWSRRQPAKTDPAAEIPPAAASKRRRTRPIQY